MKVDLTREEKSILAMVHNNLLEEAEKTSNTLGAMKLKERVQGNDNLEMVQEYLQKQMIDLKNSYNAIEMLYDTPKSN